MTEAGKTTRAILNGYQDRRRAVEEKRMEVEALRRFSLRGRSLSASHSYGNGSPIERLVIRLEREREELRKMEAALRKHRTIVERYIAEIEDPFMRRVFRSRFIEGLSWTRIIVRHGGWGSEDGARMAVCRYIDRHPMREDLAKLSICK